MIGLLLNRTVSKGQTLITKNFLNSMIDILGKNVVIIDSNRSNKTKRLLQRDDIAFMHIPWDNASDNWKTYYDKCVNSCKDIDTLIIFSSAIYEVVGHNNYGLFKGFDKRFSQGEYDHYTKYVIVKNLLAKYSIIKSCVDNNKKIIQFILDPQEPYFPSYFETGTNAYILNKNDLVYAPSYEYALFNNATHVLHKTHDFVFYCTALTEDRKYIVDNEYKLKTINSSDVQIHTSIKSNHNYVSQEEYYDKLANSKYTLVIPSYDVSTFSIIRFLEAIANDCIPLVLDNCDLTDLKTTFPDIYDIVDKYLIVNLDNIHECIEQLDYESILKLINDTNTIKNFKNLDYFKNIWKNTIEENLT